MENNLPLVEEYYKKISANLNAWLPEGVIEVDLVFLQSLGLLKYHSLDKKDFSLTRYFQLLESTEKITLINDQFIVWIVPEKIHERAMTYVLIALNHPQNPHLETAFTTTGIYNSSRLVLRILEKILFEIQETEDAIKTIKKM